MRVARSRFVLGVSMNLGGDPKRMTEERNDQPGEFSDFVMGTIRTEPREKGELLIRFTGRNGVLMVEDVLDFIGENVKAINGMAKGMKRKKELNRLPAFVVVGIECDGEHFQILIRECQASVTMECDAPQCEKRGTFFHELGKDAYGKARKAGWAIYFNEGDGPNFCYCPRHHLHVPDPGQYRMPAIREA